MIGQRTTPSTSPRARVKSTCHAMPSATQRAIQLPPPARVSSGAALIGKDGPTRNGARGEAAAAAVGSLPGFACEKSTPAVLPSVVFLFGCFVKGPFNTQRGVKNLLSQFWGLHRLHPQCGCSSGKCASGALGLLFPFASQTGNPRIYRKSWECKSYRRNSSDHERCLYTAAVSRHLRPEVPALPRPPVVRAAPKARVASGGLRGWGHAGCQPHPATRHPTPPNRPKPTLSHN